jgi:hypothetical protein
MWLLQRLAGRSEDTAPPRSVDEIRAEIELRDSRHVRRFNRVEQSLYELTAEVGLEDLRRRIEEHDACG